MVQTGHKKRDTSDEYIRRRRGKKCWNKIGVVKWEIQEAAAKNTEQKEKRPIPCLMI